MQQPSAGVAPALALQRILLISRITGRLTCVWYEAGSLIFYFFLRGAIIFELESVLLYKKHLRYCLFQLNIIAVS
ncbi:hypothetical protein BC830DRAFT_151842 [Chytriomyces sp. MP71]|nr:hypothetical protein BC830DRAFT_151842 [Chytriomyces sp. MP71]